MRELWMSSVGSRSTRFVCAGAFRLWVVRTLTVALFLVAWSAATVAAEDTLPDSATILAELPEPLHAALVFAATELRAHPGLATPSARRTI